MPPILRILIPFIALFFVLLTYSKLHSTRDPSSYFFDAQRAYEPIYSAQREQEAASFVERVAMSNWLHTAKPPADIKPWTLKPGIPEPAARTLCIGIPTMSRQGKQHFPAAVGSLLDGLSVEERAQIWLITFFASLEPEADVEEKAPWLSKLADRVLTRTNITDALRQLVANGKKEEKSTMDYRKVLGECYATGTQYVLIVEDDIIAAKSWYPRTMKALDDITAKHARDGKDWLYLRLFYSETFLGWNNEEWKVYTFWVVFTMVASLASLLGMNLFLERYSPPRNLKRFKVSNSAIAVIMMVCVPMLIGAYFLSGRLTMNPFPNGIVKMNNYGCCSQGLVFERSRVPDVIQVLDPTIKQEKFGIMKSLFPDERLERLADQQGWDRWAIVPSVFQHVGRQSAYGFSRKTWNFRFEADGGWEIEDENNTLGNATILQH